MAKLYSLVASLCFFALLGAVYAHDTTYHIQGKVFCDTCRVLFQTSVSEYISGASVRLECRDRVDEKNITYSVEGVTDASGTYHLPVVGDHDEEICEVILINSPRIECSEKLPLRDRARVLCTQNNGVVIPVRFANPLGFLLGRPLDVCPKILALMGLLPDVMIAY